MHLIEDFIDVSPFGQVLVLKCPVGGVVLKAGAVSDRLRKYCDGRMPSTGVLVDLGGTDYRFSSADLASVASGIAAWERGWVAPCAIVLTGAAATDLQRLLDLTKLSTIEELQVVGNADEALTHIRRQLERRAV